MSTKIKSVLENLSYNELLHLISVTPSEETRDIVIDRVLRRVPYTSACKLHTMSKMNSRLNSWLEKANYVIKRKYDASLRIPNIANIDISMADYKKLARASFFGLKDITFRRLINTPGIGESTANNVMKAIEKYRTDKVSWSVSSIDKF